MVDIKKDNEEAKLGEILDKFSGASYYDTYEEKQKRTKDTGDFLKDLHHLKGLLSGDEDTFKKQIKLYKDLADSVNAIFFGLRPMGSEVYQAVVDGYRDKTKFLYAIGIFDNKDNLSDISRVLDIIRDDYSDDETCTSTHFWDILTMHLGTAANPSIDGKEIIRGFYKLSKLTDEQIKTIIDFANLEKKLVRLIGNLELLRNNEDLATKQTR